MIDQSPWRRLSDLMAAVVCCVATTFTLQNFSDVGHDIAFAIGTMLFLETRSLARDFEIAEMLKKLLDRERSDRADESDVPYPGVRF